MVLADLFPFPHLSIAPSHTKHHLSPLRCHHKSKDRTMPMLMPPNPFRFSANPPTLRLPSFLWLRSLQSRTTSTRVKTGICEDFHTRLLPFNLHRSHSPFSVLHTLCLFACSLNRAFTHWVNSYLRTEDAEVEDLSTAFEVRKDELRTLWERDSL